MDLIDDDVLNQILGDPDRPPNEQDQTAIATEPWFTDEAQAALTAAILGATIGLSVYQALYSQFPQFWIYLTALAFFHFMEYFITALVNIDSLNANSFLLFNGYSYAIAHLVAVVEALVEHYYFDIQPNVYLSAIGLVIMVVCQYIRSLAMYIAGKSFSHTISKEKKSSHVLVTHGIYAYSRHPSYFGFFFWALGTQLLLGNPISFIGFAVVLWDFFKQRIQYEEMYLIAFFGPEYNKYRANVPTLIPFIP